MSMRVVIAPDKFKGSLTAAEAARAMADGVLVAEPGAQVVLCPMADGGEGTVEAVLAATAGELRQDVVSGPLPGQKVDARWALLPAGTLAPFADSRQIEGFLAAGEATAVLEMAQASGFSLVPEGRRDPMATSTIGTGELILEALDAGCRQVILGLGGSGTVDGGMGMATALGYRFLDIDGSDLSPGGASLSRIDSIDTSGSDPRLSEARFLVASDVDNPLVGAQGAARVFGPQKGATTEQVEALDTGLRLLGEAINRSLGIDVLEMPGAGAAGGLGAGLVAFCGAEIVSGVRLIASLTGLANKVDGADLVLTGEGSFDSQTARGKTPAGVVEVARERGVPVVVIAGRLAGDTDGSAVSGVATYSILPGPMDLSEAMEEAAEILKTGTARLLRLLNLMPRHGRGPA